MKTLMAASAMSMAFVLANSAMAADVGVYASSGVQPVFNVPIYSWTGCYIGAEGGWSGGLSRHDTSLGAATSGYTVAGPLFGGTVGCNYQINQVVLGLEGDFSWLGKSGSGTAIPPFEPNGSSETKEQWLGTVRGRLGFTPFEKWLIYVTGGYAAASVQAHVVNPVLLIDVTETKTRGGWTAGVGAEWAVWNNWSWKFEYLHVALNNDTYFASAPSGVTPRTGVPLTDDIIRLGLNYRFFGVNY
jgi:outer membrane immunogenic protein